MYFSDDEHVYYVQALPDIFGCGVGATNAWTLLFAHGVNGSWHAAKATISAKRLTWVLLTTRQATVTTQCTT